MRKSHYFLCLMDSDFHLPKKDHAENVTETMAELVDTIPVQVDSISFFFIPIEPGLQPVS